MMHLKIIIEESVDGEEDQIIVRCRQMTPELFRTLNILKTQEMLIAYDGSQIHRVSQPNIYYIETVENKTFLYCKEKVYESKKKLYVLEEELLGGDFLRISKSVIINLSKVKTLTPALSGRLEAVLQNGEKVIISRQYVSDLKKRLGI